MYLMTFRSTNVTMDALDVQLHALDNEADALDALGVELDAMEVWLDDKYNDSVMDSDTDTSDICDVSHQSNDSIVIDKDVCKSVVYDALKAKFDDKVIIGDSLHEALSLGYKVEIKYRATKETKKGPARDAEIVQVVDADDSARCTWGRHTNCSVSNRAIIKILPGQIYLRSYCEDGKDFLYDENGKHIFNDAANAQRAENHHTAKKRIAEIDACLATGDVSKKEAIELEYEKQRLIDANHALKKSNDHARIMAEAAQMEDATAAENHRMTSVVYRQNKQALEGKSLGKICHSPRCCKPITQTSLQYNSYNYCSSKCLSFYLEGQKDATLRSQENATIRNQMKPLPSKPLIRQLQEKAQHLKSLIPSHINYFLEDDVSHLVFVDTESNGHEGTIEYCRELSFYSTKLAKWIIIDMDMNDNNRIASLFNQLMAVFPDPVVFVHYNYTENKLLEDLFRRFDGFAPLHSYVDLLPLARALIDTNNPNSPRMYCTTRNLSVIGNYWFEGSDYQFNIPRHYRLKATTGKKSELDVCMLYNLYYDTKKYIVSNKV